VTLDQIEQWFKDNPPRDNVRVNRFSVVVDGEKFVKSHLAALRNNSGNKTFLPYYDRMIEYIEVLKND